MSIIVYTKRGCPWCEDLLVFLKEKAIDFEEREVRSNGVYFGQMVDISGQTKAPTVVINGVVYPDTDVDQIRNILNI